MKNNDLTLEKKYKVQIIFDDSTVIKDTLISFYLPLMKSEAYALYMFFITESKNPMISTLFQPIERIISMLNISIERIMKLLIKLEILNLIKINEMIDGEYIFEILEPLKPEEFINSPQMLELLISSIGEQNLEINKKMFNSIRKSTITPNNKIDLTTKSEINTNSLNVDFQFETIKNILLAKKIDPISIWSEELEKSIIDQVVIYNISSFDISVEIINLIENNNFTIKYLESTIKNKYTRTENIDEILNISEKRSEKKLNILRNISIDEYIKNKFNREISEFEKKLIIKLKKQFNIDNEKIIILFDFSAIVNDNVIVENYILKIAKTMQKNKIDTTEKLINHLKTSYKLRGNNNSQNDELIEVPEF